ncbi:MAG: diguanylate cyclase response regulator [Gammaproteobacteria bacterium]
MDHMTTEGVKQVPTGFSVIIIGLGTNPNRLARRIRHIAGGTIRSIDVATDLEWVREATRLKCYDVALLDVDPYRHGVDEVEQYVKACGVTPVIAISHADDFQIQEQMLRIGVQDYLVKKKTGSTHLTSSIVHAIERKRLELELKSTLGELAQVNAELKRLTLRDSLTGVLNRRAFLAFADQAIARAERAHGQLVLLYCDLDQFKQVNDTLGHSAGDQYLQTFCRRVEATLRRSDVIGRVGGDEFLILLEDADWERALETVQRIRRETGKPLTLEGRELTPKVSIGIATYPESRTVNDLIRRADEAMYAAKGRGGDNGGEKAPSDGDTTGGRELDLI